MESKKFAKISPYFTRCISIRESNPKQISVGEDYILDKYSIFIDCDGDAYGTFYDMEGNRIGNLLLKHFTSI